MSPPYWNCDDFCGASLLQAATRFGDRIDPEVLDGIDAASRHAAGSIRRRNVNLDYTNIAILGTYVTLYAGQHLNWAEMTNYAIDRLARFHAFTLSSRASACSFDPTPCA